MYRALGHIMLVLLLFFSNISPNIAKKEGCQIYVKSQQPGIQKVLGTNSDLNRTILPVLLVEFEDVRFSVGNPKESFNELFNGRGYSRNGATGSVAEWLDANFKGKTSFVFEISDVITLPKPVAAYGAPGAVANDSDILGMVADACNAAVSAGVDFSRYDNNGDSMADNVSIVFAGYSQAEGGSIDSIWPHQMDIKENGLNFGGTAIASFVCNAELSGNSGATIAPIGHFCHELSHFLGLPDLYDTNGEEEGESPATYGTLSIMDRGNFLNGGKTPPMFNAAEREILGLCEMEDLLPDKSYTLMPASHSDKVYRIKTSNEGEYFLLECRSASGWDAHIGGSGLVVYHIDKSAKVHGGLSGAERWIFNNINSYAGHECLRVLSAVGATDKVGEVFFPGEAGVEELLPSGGKMPLTDWAGHPVGVGIVDISYSGGKVSFKTVKELSFNPELPVAVECVAHPYQKDIRIGWLLPESDIEDLQGMQWLVKWREKGSGGDFSSIAVDGDLYCITGVKPGCEYEIVICALKDGEFGMGHRLYTKTLPLTSPFPYIYVHKDGYEVGMTMDLRLVNLVEKHVSVTWFVNGMPVEGESMLLDAAGEMEIMAVIVYSDGSQERIYKRIQVR